MSFRGLKDTHTSKMRRLLRQVEQLEVIQKSQELAMTAELKQRTNQLGEMSEDEKKAFLATYSKIPGKVRSYSEQQTALLNKIKAELTSSLS